MASALGTPFITSGTLTGATDIAIPGVGRRELLLENTDATNSFTFVFNDGTGVWTLSKGKAIGLYVTGGVIKVTLTPVAGNPTYQLLVYG